MNSRIAAALIVAAALVFGVAGYVFGVRSGGPDEAQTIAAVEKYFEAHPERLAGGTAAPEPQAGAQLNESQIAEVRDIVRDHLVTNPEIIRDAIDALQRKEMEAEIAAQASIIADDSDRIFASSRQVVLGNPDGDVTLVEFFDYNCGYCKRAHADMKRLIAEDPNLRMVLKEFPVLGDGSVEAARVGVAVNLVAPEKYAEFHDALISVRGQVDGARALAVAQDMGLDMDEIQKTMPTDEVKDTIAEVYDLANKLSLTGTPSYVTPNEVVVGAVGYDTLKAKIDEARGCETANC